MNKGNYRHGMKGTKPYTSWRNMKDRCLNHNNKEWKNYGGRGIKINKEWMDFVNFWEDMKEGYSEGLTLDRINVDDGYYKDNCKWSTWKEQAANKRNSITYKGETARSAGLRINKNPSLVYQRLNAGWDIKTSFTKPSRRPK